MIRAIAYVSGHDGVANCRAKIPTFHLVVVHFRV
jgi:hypothetical protein